MPVCVWGFMGIPFLLVHFKYCPEDFIKVVVKRALNPPLSSEQPVAPRTLPLAGFGSGLCWRLRVEGLWRDQNYAVTTIIFPESSCIEL